jgi:lysophospholipase L1-like esterase
MITAVRLRFAACLILFIALSLPAADNPRLVERLAAGKPQVVVAYGTSLTHMGAWVQMLDQELQARFPGLVRVVNGAQSAKWSTWGVQHLDERVLSRKPDTVFIEFAINDAYLPYKTTVPTARKNLETMIDRILAAKADTEIILMTMNPPTAVHLEQRPGIEQYIAMYRAVAAERKLQLIDQYPHWQRILAEDPERFRRLVPDGIHPAAAGSAEVTMPLLRAALGLADGAPAGK